MTVFPFFATTPKGVEAYLANEFKALGAENISTAKAGVAFTASLATAYRTCLWSRLANRILMPLAKFTAPTPEVLYAETLKIDWTQHLSPQGTLAVDCNLTRSNITHSQYAALKVKDAIVDQFRTAYGERPSVDTLKPDIRINLRIRENKATLSLDLSGDSLHKRGYRVADVTAPLKENLAAAILIGADWPEAARRQGALIDPMCGSATLLIEGALIAGDIAPGILRSYFGFLKWLGHDSAAWQQLLQEAQQRRQEGLKNLPLIKGYDADPRAVKAAKANIDAAGLSNYVQAEKNDITTLKIPVEIKKGLVVVNPPYGERLGESRELQHLYARLGEKIRSLFPSYAAAVFTGNPDLAVHLGMKPTSITTLFNGAIECRLFAYANYNSIREENKPLPPQLTSGGQMFANRLKKNIKHYGRWARRENVYCYRVYDADLPDYAFAIDIYHGEEIWVQVQEYQAPSTIDPVKAEARLYEAAAIIPSLLDIPADHMYLKVRRQQKGTDQYSKLADQGHFHIVQEGNCQLLVNFTDYLDTGLFLDHRPIRLTIQQLAKNKRFLNLFGYTGTATIHAARGGASATTTVDMSRTYIEWASRNLALNGFMGKQHELIQADCLEWLRQATEDPKRRGSYDLIFLDPPTFSNSKRMENNFDIQRDHPQLIIAATQLLAADGILFFSTNFRKFKLEGEALNALAVKDISRSTIAPDFERDPGIHRCWQIQR